MKIRRDENNGQDLINMSSLLDVMFILIIFFLATATFQEEEHDIEVSLPSAGGQAASLTDAPKLLVINVRADGTYNVASRSMTLQELEQEVMNAVQANTQQKVLVRGDADVRHGNVAAAIAICKRSGVHKAHIGYEYAGD